MIGDYTDEDAYDPTAPADAEQVARKLAAYDGLLPWERLDADERRRRVAVCVKLLAWLARSGHVR